VHEACEGVERIADRVRRESPDARVLLVAPPRVVLEKLPPDSNTQGDRLILPETLGWLERLGDAYRKVAERNGWTYLTLFPLLDKADFADAAHPNAAGNRKMADAVLRALPRSTRNERLRRKPNL
jgi:lysophospholipase L1-like esterase